MKRLLCKEWIECDALPEFFRTEILRFIAVFAGKSGVYTPAAQQIARMIPPGDPPSSVRIHDICAGGGHYLERILRHLPDTAKTRVRQIVLSDLFPPPDAREFEERTYGTVRYLPSGMDAVEAVRNAEPDTVFVMFSALHHFDETQLTELLTALAEKEAPFCFFDYVSRDILREFAPTLFAPLFMWLLTPLIRPWSFRRFLFTYPIPILPAIFLVDSTISRLRAYSGPMLSALAKNVKAPPEYRLDTGHYFVFGRTCRVQWISGGVRRNSP